jgi:adenylate kinase
VKLMLLGAPGAGKGTQAEYIGEQFNIPTISTGAMLRAAVKSGSEIGLRAQSFMESGRLVPDEVVIGIVAESLRQPEFANGFILDGFPRNVAQAKALSDLGIQLDKVLLIDVDDDVIVERISGRRNCGKCGAGYHTVFDPPKTEGVCDKCGGALTQRSDDTAETVEKRLQTYHAETAPLIDFYRDKGILVTAKGHVLLEVTKERVLAALEGRDADR